MVPVTGAVAEYRGQRYRILFGGDDWVALDADPATDIPDAFARGESPRGQGQLGPWAKLPISALDGVIDVVVSGAIAGHRVSVVRQLPDGRINVGFVGDPAAASEMGLTGDQYMGWTGVVSPDDLTDIHVEETRRA